MPTDDCGKLRQFGILSLEDLNFATEPDLVEAGLKTFQARKIIAGRKACVTGAFKISEADCAVLEKFGITTMRDLKLATEADLVEAGVSPFKARILVNASKAGSGTSDAAAAVKPKKKSSTGKRKAKARAKQRTQSHATPATALPTAHLDPGSSSAGYEAEAGSSSMPLGSSAQASKRVPGYTRHTWSNADAFFHAESFKVEVESSVESEESGEEAVPFDRSAAVATWATDRPFDHSAAVATWATDRSEDVKNTSELKRATFKLFSFSR